jgi:predicted membrane-bound spermidine synthase
MIRKPFVETSESGLVDTTTGAAGTQRACVDTTSIAQIRAGLIPLFFLSGIAALVYQVCWQRMLFVAFGVDIDSVTIIVSTFMFGLGVGALIGGELADRFPNHLLTIFSVIELTIGLFGFLSHALIPAVGAITIRGSLTTIAVANFFLLLVPTTMMGATLPVLVAHVVRSYKSIGVSIGLLYFVNTLGAAVGAAATGLIGLYFLGLADTIYAAATLNLLVSAAVWFWLRRA